MLASVLLPHLLPFHLHIGAGQPGTTKPLTLLPSLVVGAETFLLLPVGFMVEDVFFRGALDTYIHREEKGVGWLSAIFVSALWGLWHLPVQANLDRAHLLSTVIGLLIAQIAVGVPLSLWWRKSGNLTVTDTTHALIDAVRNALAAGV